MTYEQEVTQLANELQRDDPSLSTADARRLAREQMTELYRAALEWYKAAAAQRAQRVTAA